jgi:hypothetical protein
MRKVEPIQFPKGRISVADGRRDEGLRAAIKAHGGKIGNGTYGRTNFWPSLQKLSGDQSWKVARSGALA